MCIIGSRSRTGRCPTSPAIELHRTIRLINLFSFALPLTITKPYSISKHLPRAAFLESGASQELDYRVMRERF